MKKFLLSMVVLSLSVTSAQAHIDSNFTQTEQYMLNSGYSRSMANYAHITNRDPYAPTDDIYPEHSAKRFFKVLWKKIDPTAFPDENSNWHNIQLNTGFYDLN